MDGAKGTSVLRQNEKDTEVYDALLLSPNIGFDQSARHANIH